MNVNNDRRNFKNWLKQSCHAYSNHTKNILLAMERIGNDKNPKILLNPQAENLDLLCSYGFFICEINGIFHQNFVLRQHMKLLHHPFHTRASNTFEGNLIPDINGAELLYSPKRNTNYKSRAVSKKNSSEKLRKKFDKLCGSADEKMIDLHKEFGNIRSIGNEFGMLASAYEEKIPILEKDLTHVRKMVGTFKKDMQNMDSTQQSLKRVIWKMSSQSKRQNDFNEKVNTMNARRLVHVNKKLNEVTKEMLNQKLAIQELTLVMKQNSDRLQKDFEYMFDAQQNGLAAELDKQMNQIHKTRVVFLVLLLTSTVPVKYFVEKWVLGSFFPDECNRRKAFK